MPTTSYPRSRADVAGDFVRGMARALVRRGHRVEILAPEPREEGEPFAEPGIEVRFVPYLRPRTLERTFYGAGVPDNVRADPRAALGLATHPLALAAALAARVGRWDAIVSHWTLPSALAAGLVRGARPHLAISHSADVHLLSRLPLRRAIAGAVERSASALWFVAEPLRARFEAALGRPLAGPVHVGPMGFDPPRRLDAEREALRAAHGLTGMVVLTLGRQVPIKGLDALIRAMAGLPDATLILAGDGPERGRLEELARALGVRARFVGVVRERAKDELFAMADAFVLPSRTSASGRSEGAPIALLEAMSAGLPIVATRSGGIAATLRGAGTLVPEDDPAAIAGALRALGPARGERGPAIVRALAWDTRIDQVLALLGNSASCITNRSPGG